MPSTLSAPQRSRRSLPWRSPPPAPRQPDPGPRHLRRLLRRHRSHHRPHRRRPLLSGPQQLAAIPAIRSTATTPSPPSTSHRAAAKQGPPDHAAPRRQPRKHLSRGRQHLRHRPRLERDLPVHRSTPQSAAAALHRPGLHADLRGRHHQRPARLCDQPAHRRRPRSGLHHRDHQQHHRSQPQSRSAGIPSTVS